jgi:hypothetical protein
VLLPWWDMLFGTANFESRYDPTGIRDQVEKPPNRDYGRGFWAQQWLGLKRLARQGLTAAPMGLMRLLLDSFWRAVAYCLHPARHRAVAAAVAA